MSGCGRVVGFAVDEALASNAERFVMAYALKMGLVFCPKSCFDPDVWERGHLGQWLTLEVEKGKIGGDCNLIAISANKFEGTPPLDIWSETTQRLKWIETIGRSPPLSDSNTSWEASSPQPSSTTLIPASAQTLETEETRKRKEQDVDLMRKRIMFLEEENRELRSKLGDSIREKENVLDSMMETRLETERQKEQNILDMNDAHKLAQEYKRQFEESQKEIEGMKQSSDFSRENLALRTLCQTLEATNKRLETEVKSGPIKREKATSTDATVQTEEAEEKILIQNMYKNQDLFEYICANHPTMVRDFFHAMVVLKLT